jgi:hypothetical protein
VERIKKYCVESRRKRKTLHKLTQRKANWIGHILRRNWVLKHVFERKIEEHTTVARRERERERESKHKQLLELEKRKN